MKYFYDTEFLEDGRTIELISIGIWCEDGREYYAVNSDMDQDRVRKHTWLSRNVWPHLPLRGYTEGLTYVGGEEGHAVRPKDLGILDVRDSCVKPHWVIANEVRDFICGDDHLTDMAAEDSRPELWAYYGAYDHVALCQLWGTMMQLPDGMPMFTHELMQMWEQAGRPEKPPQSGEHNALGDARWNARLYNTLRVSDD